MKSRHHHGLRELGPFSDVRPSPCPAAHPLRASPGPTAGLSPPGRPQAPLPLASLGDHSAAGPGPLSASAASVGRACPGPSAGSGSALHTTARPQAGPVSNKADANPEPSAGGAQAVTPSSSCKCTKWEGDSGGMRCHARRQLLPCACAQCGGTTSATAAGAEWRGRVVARRSPPCWPEGEGCPMAPSEEELGPKPAVRAGK